MIAAHHLRISPKHGFPFRVLPKPPEPTAKVRKSSSSPDQKFSILETISPFWFRQSWRLISGNSCYFPRFLAKKGGVGCFLTKIHRMSLMVLGLRGGYLVSFARFCDTFVTFLRGRRGLGGCCGRGGRQRRGRLLWSATLAWQTRNTGKGTARVGHPAFPASATVFRIFSCMVSALRRTTSIVRFWGLIACKVWRTFLGGLVFCFVGFSDGGEFRGLDNSWGAGWWGTRRLTG